MIVIQYPVINNNITVLLNSHPNIAISNNLRLLDKVAKFLYDETLTLEGDDAFFDSILDDLSEREPLSVQFEHKKVKVIGDSVGFTLLQMNSWFHQNPHHFELCLKKLSFLHMPISLLFVNTAPRDESTHEPEVTAYVNTVDIIARSINASVLSIEHHHSSPQPFLTQVCTFLQLTCSHNFILGNS